MNSRLNLDSNLAAPDDFYEALIDAHQELDDEQSKMLNAQLVLLLSNHIGNLAVLLEALAIARANAGVQPR
ncbi:DUF2783 domain-containing protein [Massilia sp. METH4]|uniref:DUF2783 domain-containing protein n=1 Tax=Massilia sp. METH4 TaxID=3123041 RepID=UPI0030CD4A30